MTKMFPFSLKVLTKIKPTYNNAINISAIPLAPADNLVPAFFLSWEIEDTGEAAAAEIDDDLSELNGFLDAKVAEEEETRGDVEAEALERVFLEADGETFEDDTDEADLAVDCMDWLGPLLTENNELAELPVEAAVEEAAGEAADEETAFDEEK